MLQDLMLYGPPVVGGIVLIVLVVLLIRYLRARPDAYFVRWLSNDQLRALQLGGVPYSTEMVEGEEGIRLLRQHRRQTLSLLKTRVVSTFPVHARLHEMVLLEKTKPNPELERFKVTLDGRLYLSKINFIGHWLRSRRLNRLVREVLLPTVHCDIAVHMMWGKNHKLPGDRKFHIFVWSAPSGSANKTPTASIFGVPVHDGRHAFGITEGGIPLVDDHTGFIPAELVDNCLYLHHSAITKANGVELALLLRLLQAAKEELVVDKFLDEIVQSLPEDGLPIGPEHAGNHTVTEQGFEGRRKAVITSLIHDVLIPAVQCDVFVKHCNGRVQKPPKEDGMFHVLCQSSPFGKACIKTPETLWGHRLLKRENAFLPTGRGLPIVTDTGFALAELVGNNLYVHQDLVHSGSRVGAALFARLLLEVRKQLALERAGGQAQAEAFQKECLRQVGSARGVTGGGIDMRQAETDLQVALKETRSLEQYLFRLENSPDDALGREFDELCNIKKVLDVRMTDGYLVVNTDLLYCIDPRTSLRHEIGAFEIYIPLSGGVPTWKNQTRRVGGHEGRSMNAPHVDANGAGCLGNTKDLFPQMIEKREFASAVELAIAFVESVNTSDTWGKYVNNWPLAHG